MTTTHINGKNYSESQILNAFLQAATCHQASIVFWNEPNSQQLCLLVNFSQAVACQISDKLAAGFIFSPFLSTNKACFFLQAELFYTIENKQLLEKSIVGHAKKQAFLTTVINCLNQAKKSDYFVGIAPVDSSADLKACFIALVKQGLREIKNSAFEKIVFARTKTIKLPDNFDLISTFQRIRQTYPQHFISLISTADYGSWLGCSPELLLAIEGLALQTVSLAGTKLNTQAWTEKEYQEQALVTEFIRQQLHQLTIMDVEEMPPTNLTIGAFKHLQTQFKIHLNSQQSLNQTAERLLALLHPTPAVCGMPKQEALDFIQQHESFDRQLYCGYLGPCNIDKGKIQLYVNIRCLQLVTHHAILYAGAGITEASDPEKEWEETELKCQTLLDFL